MTSDVQKIDLTQEEHAQQRERFLSLLKSAGPTYTNYALQDERFLSLLKSAVPNYGNYDLQARGRLAPAQLIIAQFRDVVEKNPAKVEKKLLDESINLFKAILMPLLYERQFHNLDLSISVLQNYLSIENVFLLREHAKRVDPRDSEVFDGVVNYCVSFSNLSKYQSTEQLNNRHVYRTNVIYEALSSIDNFPPAALVSSK